MKIILPVLFLFLFTVVSGQGIVFMEGNFSEALAKAKKENKLVFIDCYTTWCGPCKWLSANVFTNKKAGEYFNSHFINFKLDMEKGEGKDVRTKYQVAAYPTLLFIDGDGIMQHRAVGAMDTVAFLKLGELAQDTSKNFGSFLKKYHSGNRDASFLASYAQVCFQAYYPFDIDEYFKTQTDEQLASETNFNLIEMYNPPMNSRAFKVMLTNRPKFYQSIGRYRTDYRIKYIILKNIYLNEKNIDLVNLKPFLMPLIKPFGIDDSVQISLKSEMEYHQNRSRNWERYMEILSTLVSKYGNASLSEYEWVQVCENLVLNSATIPSADIKVKEYIALGENSGALKFKYCLVQAWLLSKEKKDYQTWITQAKELAAKENVTEAQFEKIRKSYFPE